MEAQTTSDRPFIAGGVTEESFPSPHDGSRQTFLLKDYRPSPLEGGPLLVIYLHGANHHQEQGMTAGIYGNAFGRLGQFLNAQGAVYACPEYRGNSWMGPAAEADLGEILRRLKARFAPSKTLLMGGSMGGTSVLIYAARHPRDIDGVLALCPATDTAEVFERDDRFRPGFIASYGGAPAERPGEYFERSSRNFIQRLATLPIALSHGTADASIPFHHSRRLADELDKAGARFLFEVIEGGGHDSPLERPLDRFFPFFGVEPR